MLKVGEAVAKQIALQWLAEKKAGSRRGRDLAQLVRARFPLRRQERDVLAALTSIEDDVAERLTPGLTDAAHGLAENEREAALASVADALLAADLSDTGLFAADLDPSALASAVRAQWPVARAALSSPAERLFEIGLDRACVVLTHLVRELPEFDAAVGVEQLRRLRAVLDGIDRVLDRLPSRELGAPEGTDFDAQFRHRYLDRVVRSYERLEVIGLTTHSYEPRTTLSVAYLSLTVTADAERAGRRPRDRGVAGWLGQDPGARQATENIRVEAALGGSRLTVIRGEAGAGKSTLLRWLAVNAARSAFTDQLAGWNGCVPFLVKLRDFADGQLPRGDELLTQPSSPPWGPAPREWVHRRLESGEALLLVDGVDELVATRRAAVRTWLRDLLAGYPDIRVVVTSRPTAVTSKWLLAEGFRSVVLEPMSAADVLVFLRRWHAALLDSTSAPDLLPCRPEEVPEHQRALLAQLQARPHLRALARSPLLCAMVCALNLDRRARLPRDRLALYSAALEMLLERRDADRNVSAGDDIQATVAEKLALLRALAWWLNENGRTEMSRAQALARISSRLRGMPGVSESAEVLLDHLIERSGVIRQPVAGRVDFIHRTFQEFLAAGEAVDRDSIDLLVSHARSDLWRETVLMACAQASPDQRGRLLSGILDSAASASAKNARQLLLLAAACRETAVLAPPEVLGRLDLAVRILTPPRSVRESRSLATVGESILDYLPDHLADLSEPQAAACVRTAALVNGPEALEALARYASDPRAKVQEEIVASWKYFDPETYTRRVLTDAPLTLDKRRFTEIDFAAAIKFLHHLTKLTQIRVNLWDLGPVNDEIHTISQLHHLQKLILLADIAPDTVTELSRLTNLDHLFINFTRGWPRELSGLAALTRVRQLYLNNASDVRDFSFLAGMPSLECIHLMHNPLSAWVDHVAEPTKITDFTCSSRTDTKTLAKAAARLSGTEFIVFDGCSNLDLRALAALDLRHVMFVGRSDIDITPLTEHRSLRFLNLRNFRGEVNLAPFADLKIAIWLGPDVVATGIDKLGPGVTLNRR
ncbi:NACHT domain-containing protein [Amycolatopsis sp. NPDC050768]|uniref:NACHT domain-containing protein n=1 Tax=Amycolatopsis sp. NPDC050768 TaxID=3154839 RepID=UPI0033D921D4